MLDALRARGLSAATWAWDDTTVDWAVAHLVVLRSTWNYYRNRPAFLRWAKRVAAVTALHNPLDLIEWNTHKSYLLDLEQRGVKIVPTELVGRGSSESLAAIRQRRGWTDVVIKPAVAAASFGAHVVTAGEDGQRTFAALVADGDTLVQPFIESVRDHGERSLIMIDGELTHSVRKEPRFGDDAERVSGPHPIAGDEAHLAGAAVAALPVDAPLLYGRVDVVRDASGQPMVSELELAEPSLFFPFSTMALQRMTDAIARLLGRPPAT